VKLLLDVRIEKVSAEYNNGALKLTAPKGHSAANAVPVPVAACAVLGGATYARSLEWLQYAPSLRAGRYAGVNLQCFVRPGTTASRR
jgi:hypothetical protein